MEKFSQWLDPAYRLAVIVLLTFIAWQQVGQKNAIVSISDSIPEARDVQDVRVVNEASDRIPVEAEISVKTDYVGGVAVQESLPVKVTNSGLTETVPVSVRPY